MLHQQKCMHLVTSHQNISCACISCVCESEFSSSLKSICLRTITKRNKKLDKVSGRTTMSLRFNVDICHVPINDSLPKNRSQLLMFLYWTKSLILFPIDRQTDTRHIVNGDTKYWFYRPQFFSSLYSYTSTYTIDCIEHSIPCLLNRFYFRSITI